MDNGRNARAKLQKRQRTVPFEDSDSFLNSLSDSDQPKQKKHKKMVEYDDDSSDEDEQLVEFISGKYKGSRGVIVPTQPGELKPKHVLVEIQVSNNVDPRDLPKQIQTKLKKIKYLN